MMVVGDFDTDTVTNLVNQYFGRVPKAAKPVPRDIPVEPPHTKEKRVTLEQPWPLPAVIVAYHVPYNGHPDSYPMFVMSKTLSDGQTSRIYRKLVYETGLALTAFGSSSFLEQPGIFSAVALVNPGKSPDEVEKALIAEFDKLKTAGHHRARAAAGQEPVRARLHPQPAVDQGEGVAARPRRGDPERHGLGRRRVRHLPEGVARRREAGGAEVFRAGRPHGDADHAARGVVEK